MTALMLLPAATVPLVTGVVKAGPASELTDMPLMVSVAVPLFEMVRRLSLAEPTITSPNERSPDRAMIFVGVGVEGEVTFADPVFFPPLQPTANAVSPADNHNVVRVIGDP